MGKLTRTLLSSASFFALIIGGQISPAQAAACIAPGDPGNFNTAGDCDYIVINGDYGGDVVVDAGDSVTGPPFAGPTVFTPFGTHFAGLPTQTQNGLFGIVNATTGITVSGSIINNGAVAASNTGDLTISDVVVGIGNVGMDVAGIVNNGSIDVFGSDVASATSEFAYAVGINTTDTTDTAFSNAAGASLNVRALATDTVADSVFAYAAGVFQSATGISALAQVTNLGTIDVSATARVVATTGTIVFALASATGVRQFVSGSTATASVINDGVINVKALASASGIAAASATASATAIHQTVIATNGPALAVIDNSGTINFQASAVAIGTVAHAEASLWGPAQLVDGLTSATAHLINSGIIHGRAFASAVATGTLTGLETASAIALPWIITQQASAINPAGAAALVQVDNTGTAAALTLSGTAHASGLVALASVDFVEGGLDAIEQRVLARAATGPALATGVFNNGGTVMIIGNATAISPGAGGSASATVNLSWFIDQAADATRTEAKPCSILSMMDSYMARRTRSPAEAMRSSRKHRLAAFGRMLKSEMARELWASGRARRSLRITAR